jgi:hypothetical protein
MTRHVEILASLLDDGWEPSSAIRVLRTQEASDYPHHSQTRPYCLVVPEGIVADARLVADGEVFDDSMPPSQTQWLWVLAESVPHLEQLVRLYEEHAGPGGPRGR